MNRNLVVALLLIMGSVANCAGYTPINQNSEQIQDFAQNYNSIEDKNNNIQELSKIEQSYWGKNFSSQSLSTRLLRLEKKMFSTIYPRANQEERIDNIVLNYNQMNKYPNISKNELSKLEKKVLSQTFVQNSPERRIERLEQQIFGAMQSGDLTSRYEAIKMMVKTGAKNANNNIFPPIGNNFNGGTMTGFTPPLVPAGYSNFGNSNLNGARGRNMYYNDFTNYHTGVGVKILD